MPFSKLHFFRRMVRGRDHITQTLAIYLAVFASAQEVVSIPISFHEVVGNPGHSVCALNFGPLDATQSKPGF